MERHSISGPEGDQSPQLISKLAYCANETAAELCWRTFRNVQCYGYGDASSGQTTDEQLMLKKTSRLLEDIRQETTKQ
jgi:hypothetical protein